jgi:hypothetical protein
MCLSRLSPKVALSAPMAHGPTFERSQKICQLIGGCLTGFRPLLAANRAVADYKLRSVNIKWANGMGVSS